MRGTRLVLRAEAYRLLRSRAGLLALAFLAALSALRVLAGAAQRSVERSGALGSSTAGLESSGAGWAALVDGWRTGLSAGTLLLLFVAARSLAGDRESGVLRLALTRSASRSATVLARAALGVPIVLAVLAATGLAAWASAARLLDFGPLVEDGYELLSVAELRRELLLAVAAVSVPLLATWVFGLLVSSIARSGTVACAVALTLALSFDLVKDTLGEAQYLVFAAFAPSFVDGSALAMMSGRARGLSDAFFSAAVVERNWLLPAPQALAFLLLACWFHGRRSQ